MPPMTNVSSSKTSMTRRPLSGSPINRRELWHALVGRGSRATATHPPRLSTGQGPPDYPPRSLPLQFPARCRKPERHVAQNNARRLHEPEPKWEIVLDLMPSRQAKERTGSGTAPQSNRRDAKERPAPVAWWRRRARSSRIRSRRDAPHRRRHSPGGPALSLPT